MVVATELESTSRPYESRYPEMKPPSERELVYRDLRRKHEDKVQAPLSEGGVRVYKVEATRMDFWSKGFWGDHDLEDITEFVFGAPKGRISDPVPLTIRVEHDIEKISGPDGSTVSLNLGIENFLWGMEAEIPKFKSENIEPVKWVRGIVGQDTEDLQSKERMNDPFNHGHLMYDVHIATPFQNVVLGLTQGVNPVFDSEVELGIKNVQIDKEMPPDNIVLLRAS